MTEDSDMPPMNRAMEDLIAQAGGMSAEDDARLFKVWMMLGCEYHAHAVGRRATVDALMALREFVETAQPAHPWEP